MVTLKHWNTYPEPRWKPSYPTTRLNVDIRMDATQGSVGHGKGLCYGYRWPSTIDLRRKVAAWFLFLSEIDGNAGDGVVSCDVPLLPRTFCNGSECCTLSFIREVISFRFLVKALRNPHLLLLIYYHHRLDSTKVGFFVNERVELRTNLMEWFVVTNFHRISINLLPHKTKFVLLDILS